MLNPVKHSLAGVIVVNKLDCKSRGWAARSRFLNQDDFNCLPPYTVPLQCLILIWRIKGPASCGHAFISLSVTASSMGHRTEGTQGKASAPWLKEPLRKTTSPPGWLISRALCCSPDSMLGSHITNSQLDLISLTCSQLSLLLLCKVCCKFSAAWKLLRAFYFILYFSQALVFEGNLNYFKSE